MKPFLGLMHVDSDRYHEINIFHNGKVKVICKMQVKLFLGSMPEDSDLYYGFTRFALELNEKESDQVHLYAPTDTRFRPDQR